MGWLERMCYNLVRLSISFLMQCRRSSHWVNQIGHQVPVKLNFRTDPEFKKKQIQLMSNAKLLSANGATRRAVTSGVVGTSINGALSAACPIFIGAVYINLHQLTVSSINRHRVKREIKRRLTEVPGFREAYEEANKPVRDIVIGTFMRASLSTVSMGIVGMDGVIDNFTQLAAGHLHSISQSAHGASTYDIFAESHHAPAALDNEIHMANSGIGDGIGKGLNHFTGFDVDDTISWGDLKQTKITEGLPAYVTKVYQTIIQGSAAEATQTIVPMLEVLADDYLVRGDKIKVEGHSLMWQ